MIEASLEKHFRAGPNSAAFTLNVELEPVNGIASIFGPSGAGKTLILDCIAGFITPDAGRIMQNERILFDAQAKVNLPARARHCGYVFQNYALFPNMSVRENLLFAVQSGKGIEARRKANELLERFRLTDVAGRHPHQLSGGQKQRCSLARALMADSRTILLDEPSRGLDVLLRQELYATLLEVRTGFGIPMLLVTHDLEEALELSEHMTVIRDGSVVQSGSPIHICEEPANVDLARMLGIYNVLPVEIRALDPSRNTSVVRYGDYDLHAEYLPGHFRGDRIHMLVPPGQLQAQERVARPGRNQVPVELLRSVTTESGVRLEFAGGLRVQTDTLPQPHNSDWVVEFPERNLRFV